MADEIGLMIKRNRAKERCICYNRNIQSEELEMTSLIKSVPQREIEGKKQGSGKRTAQMLKEKEKGMNIPNIGMRRASGETNNTATQRR